MENNLGENIVFLVGAPRSGTTYLQRLLASHPNIKTAQESHIFDMNLWIQFYHWDQIMKNHKRKIGMPCYHTREEFVEILRDFAIKLLSPFLNELKDGDIFLEKTPLHSHYLKEIKLIFPHSKILHLVRNPFDMAKSHIHSGKTWAANSNKTARNAVKAWKNAIIKVEENKHLFKNNFKEIRYENLISNHFLILKDIFEFLEINIDSNQILEIIENNSKENMINFNGGTEIPIKGEISKEFGVTSFVEPSGFINKKTYKLNIFQKIYLFLTLRKLSKKLNYKVKF